MRATALSLSMSSLLAVAQPAQPTPAPRPQVALFQAAGFPTVDAPVLSEATLREALQGLRAETCPTVEALTATLAAGAEVLVLPYGSAFPLEAWEAIKAHLERGGSLVVLGGAPFHQPVLRVGDRWVAGQRQPTFAHALYVGPAEEIAAQGLQDPAPVPGSGWSLAPSRPTRTWALTVRFGMKKEALAEEAPDAPRDAVLRPLVHLSDSALPRACAVQEVDRLRGTFAGGRWLFATHDAPMAAREVRGLVDRALQGPAEAEALPVQACLEPGEVPRFKVWVHRPKGDSAAPRAALRLLDERGRELARTEAALVGPATNRFAEVPLPTKKALAPGFYRVEVDFPGETRVPASVQSGFWVRDAKLLARRSALQAGKDWLLRDGQIQPVVGTTYMASDVHRRFLLQPNPAVWERDFAQMEAQGINFVRTGLWAYWNRLQTGPSSLDDQALRSLDAFVHSAARHHIDVCFTFFAFLPPSYGGEHPYLDPKALEGQAGLLTQVAARYRSVPGIHYDLINEPSYATPETLWTNRPLGDRFERLAWHQWIRTRVADTVPALRDLWRDESDDVFGVPRLEDLATAGVKDGKRPRKAVDFRHFTHEVVTQWAGRAREVLQQAGGPRLVTLGQDEAGLNLSPSIQLMARNLDYTAIHNWWLNDDLLWDSLGAKVAGKPMLVNETGMMRLEDKDGTPWRSPEENARLLERKVALSFAGRAAGVVEWVWNINPYMALDNESVIGIFRPDGTAKPELRALTQVRRFLDAARPHLQDYLPESVVMVVPHSRMFMGRPMPFEGQQRLVRVMSEQFGLAPAMVSELVLTPERLASARLVIVPTPELLAPEAARALEAASRQGALVLVTGHLEGDRHGRPLPLFGTDPGLPLPYREEGATFPGQLTEKLRRGTRRTREGRLWLEPLPLELAREDEPLTALLRDALAASGVQPAASGDPMLGRMLETPTHALLIAVNEASVPRTRTWHVGAHRIPVTVEAGRTAYLLVEKASGRILVQ